MADKPVTESHADRFSVQAILAYVALFLVFWFGSLLLLMVFKRVQIDPVLLAIVGAFYTFLYGLANLALGYFLGSSSGAKTANAAMAQIAGAGAPPPAEPLSGKTK